MQTFSRFVIEADYFLSKDFIAATLCVNKAKPQMNCCGKCYLKKQLAKDTKQQPATMKKGGKEVVFLEVKSIVVFQAVSAIASSFPRQRNQSEISRFACGVFKPPCIG